MTRPEIAKAEKLRADQTALLALAEKSENDIRSCLATLQFFKSRGKPLKMVDVHKSQIGQKDSHKSHFTVWKEIFAVSMVALYIVYHLGLICQIEARYLFLISLSTKIIPFYDSTNEVFFTDSKDV